MIKDREQYTMGYGPAATGLMAMRSAQSHAGFFLPHLKPGMKVLDCGCGPGTITLGFAEVVAPGTAVGTDIEESQVASQLRMLPAPPLECAFEEYSLWCSLNQPPSCDLPVCTTRDLKEPDRGCKRLIVFLNRAA